MKFRKKKKPPQEIDINGQAERIRRYGNPTVNLFITLGIIIILALSIFLSVKKHPNNDKALERAQYYPYKVSYYADLNITELSKFHSNGKYIKLFLEGYGESFSIGRWHSEKGINNFIIAPVINERIAEKFIEVVTNKKVKSQIYKGFKIYSLKNGASYLITGKHIYISNNFYTIKDYIDESIKNKTSRLSTNETFRKALTDLRSDRAGTLVLVDHAGIFDRINEATQNTLYELASTYQKYPSMIEYSSGFFNGTQEGLDLNLRTRLDIGNIKDKHLQKTFARLLNKDSKAIHPDILPENTIAYLSVGNFKSLIDFTFQLKGAENYKEVNRFVNSITNMDFEDKILPVFEQGAALAIIKGAGKYDSTVLFIPYKEDTDKAVSKLAKIVPVQIPDSEITQQSYKKRNLEVITSPNLDKAFSYGRISPEWFVIGDKNGVEKVIDSLDSGKVMKTVNFNQDYIQNPETFIYVDWEKAKKSSILKNLTSSMPELVSNKLNSIVYTLNSDSGKINSSLQLRLKGKN